MALSSNHFNFEELQALDLLGEVIRAPAQDNTVNHLNNGDGQDDEESRLRIPPINVNGDENSDGSDDGDEDAERNESFLSHYNKYSLQCSCSPTCNFEGSKDMAYSFLKMNETERVSVVCSMMLSLTSKKG